MKTIKEPLLHFLLLGGLIFAVHGVLFSGSDAEGGRIVVTQGRIEELATTFRSVWQRPPTASELEDLVRDHIREEVATREAIAQGLDRDDPVIRHRLRQKLEFMAEDGAEQEPTDDQLRRYLADHPEAFAGPQGSLPPLDEVRRAVRREWEEAQRAAALERFYEELLRDYTVTIERPAAATAGSTDDAAR